jgi:parallel beta-helix repeat protein
MNKIKKHSMKKNLLIVLNILFVCFTVHSSYGQGSRYTGSYIKSSTIQHVGKSNFVIEGLEFTSNDRDLIVLYSCENVVIKNNSFVASPAKRGIYLDNCKNITIIDNTFDNVHTGLVAHNSRGIKFEYNDVKNVGGPMKEEDKNNGFVALFDKVNGEGNSISYNVSENIFGQSSPGDLINLNQSNGTAQSPIVVKGNWIRGGGPSPSGGGIILGDIGGSYQVAEDNIVVDGGQYGISIAGGHDIALRNNKIYGSKNYFTNVGLYACNWYEENLGKSYNITVAGNVVNYRNKEGNISNWWYASNVEPVSGKETNRYDPALSPSILPEQIIGRARMSVEPQPEPDPDEKPDDIVLDPSISIYKDTFDRICANCKGSISSSASLSVLNQNGQKILSIPIIGYHTAVDDPISSGTYTVKVESDDRLQIKKIVIN